MGVVTSGESQYGKELAKWEQFPTANAHGMGLSVLTPGRQWVYREFPRMLYMARLRPDGKVSVAETSDTVCGGGVGAAESFTSSCQMIVNDETELDRALHNGWRKTPQEAMEREAELNKFVAEAAAHRHHEDRNMSEAAKEEAAEADEATPEHVAEVPEKPRRGRPPKKV